MNDLIKVNYDTEQPTVSARDLHEGLGIEKRFSAWFEVNSKGFIENEDFTSVLSSTVVNNGAARELQDYRLSMDMAKHICLMSRTEKGHQMRQYFIDLEKAWNTPEQIMARALRFAQQSMDNLKEHCQFLGAQVVEQQKVIEELQPKASYYDMILQCKDLIATTVIAKDYGMSAKKFNVMLHDMGIQFKQGDTWVLYAKYQGNGYLKAKTCNYADTEGVQHSREHSYWTQKGRLFLYDFLKQQGVLPVVDMQPYKAQRSISQRV